MRRLVLNIHRFVALAAGLFIVILAVTGSIMAFEPELDRLAHPKLSYISPGQQPLSLDKIGHNVSHAFGGEPIVAFLPSLSPNISLQVVLPSGIAYVNQYTGEVLGLRVRGQTFLGYVRAIHVRLGGGDSGKEIVKWSSMAMLLSLASGLYLWWPMKQMQIRRTSGSKRFWFDLHNVFGIYALLPMVLLAATGVGLGFEDQLKPLLFKLTHSTARDATRKLPRTSQETGTEITPDEAVALAQAYIPGALPYRIQMPAYGGFYQVSLSNPRDRIAGRRNLVVLDRFRGTLVLINRSTDLSVADRVFAANEALHTGSIFGAPSRIAVWITCIMVLVQVASGTMMYLCRSKLMPFGIRRAKQESVS